MIGKHHYTCTCDYAFVLPDDRTVSYLAPTSSAVVLADARPAAWLAFASFAVVRALCEPLLHSDSSCPSPFHSLPTLCLSCRAGSLGQSTFSLIHRLPFPLPLKPFLLVFGLFLPLVFELLASRLTRFLFCRLVSLLDLPYNDHHCLALLSLLM
jgi:hypothetical protein